MNNNNLNIFDEYMKSLIWNKINDMCDHVIILDIYTCMWVMVLVTDYTYVLVCIR